MMGPNEPAPPAGPRQCQANRVRSSAKDAEASSTGVHSRAEKNETASNHKKMQKHPRTEPDMKGASDNVLVDFHSALMQQKQERVPETERVEYRNLTDFYNQVLAINKTHTETIARQESAVNDLSELLNLAVNNHLCPYAQNNGLEVKNWTRESFLMVLASLAKDAANANVNAADAMSYAAEVSLLSENVQTLQKEMLAKVEKVHVASDEQFAKDFRVIASLVKSLSRTININDSVDVAEVMGASPLLKDVSRHHWTSRAKKKTFVEAWIWSALIHFVFRTPFAILGKQCNGHYTTWQSMYGMGHYNHWPIPTVLSETWRYTTMESMLTLVDREIITHGKDKNKPTSVEAAIIALRRHVVNAIDRRLAEVSNVDVNRQQVNTIIDKAFSFAMQMSLQRVRFQITFPKPGSKSNNDTMKFVPDAEGEDVSEGTVAFTVNPGLTKWGDAHGKNLDHRYDIVTSLVQLATPRQQEVVQPKPAPQGLWAAVVKSGLEGASKGDRSNGGESQR
jgi:hypothetical protein